MTHSRSQSTPTSVLATPAYYAVIPFLLVPVALGGVAPPLVSSSLVAVAPGAEPAPAATVPAVAMAPASAEKSGSPSVTAAAPTPPGAGLLAPLVALLRGVEGPFLANEVFRIAPSEPLAAIEEVVPAPGWYAITRGRFVGVVDQFALSTVAIAGVAHGARKAYTTQALALDAFNRALTWGGVQVA